MAKLRSERNEFASVGGMSEKDHALRLARGASSMGMSLDEFVELLKQYVDADDDTVLDSGWLNTAWRYGYARE